jgi:tyrosyl-tRNA synthetase
LIGLPTVSLDEHEISDGITLAQLFVRAGLVNSGKDAKRLILEGGAKVNDVVSKDPNARYNKVDLAAQLKLTAGKKRNALVKLN